MNRGNYYKYRTKSFLEKEGYAVELIEQVRRIYARGQVVFVKRDVFGADGIAMNKDKIIFWQSKFNTKVASKNVASAIKEFQKFPYPDTSFIELWIVIWMPRVREPEIIPVPKFVALPDNFFKK